MNQSPIVRMSVLLSRFAIAVLAVASASASAQAIDPAEPVRSLIAVLGGKGSPAPSADAMRSAVARSFDMDGLTRAVLGGFANGATPQQLGRFSTALTGRIAHDLRARLRSDQRWTLDVVQTRAIGTDQWLLTSRVTIAGKGSRTIAWRLRSAKGHAIIIDILGNGTSMLRSLHNDYDSALRRYGLDGVIQRMAAASRKDRD